jgi:UDP-N-acetylglucosamine:LPS N-acetylglucosamine transferase
VAAFLGSLPAEEEGRPPLVTFAVGGAGAQAELARAFLPSLRPALLEGRLRLALVAGVRDDARMALLGALDEARLTGALGSGVELLHHPDLAGYVRRMNELLARTDVLWTKPSELTFYAALGLPVVCAPPVGVHERRNRRWVREAGAGVKQRAPEKAGAWLLDLVAEGQLAAAAWSGYVRLPKGGLYRILDAVAGQQTLRHTGS